MVILHVIKQLRRAGAEGVVLQLARELNADHEVTVCGFRDGPIADDLRTVGIEAVTFFPAAVRLPRLRSLLSLGRLVTELQPDIVHCHMLEANILGGWVATRHGIPTVCHVHGPAEWELSVVHRTVCGCGYSAVERRGARFVAVSHALAQQVNHLCGVTPRVIYNAVDTSRFHPGAGRGLRQELALDDNAPIVGCVGRLEYQKNPQCLLRAMARVRSVVPNAQFVIAGDGRLRADVERLAAELRLSDGLHLLGNREDIPDILPQFDVFALPSRFEGLPLCFAEAMACGLPTVGTDVTGVSEIVVDGETGFLVPSDDHEALADRIVQLLQDEDLRKRMGAAGRKRVEQHFSIPRMIEQVVAIYDEILAGRESQGQ